MAEAIDALFDRVERILDQEDKPTKMSRELRDAFMFYTAHHVREMNGKVKKHDRQLAIMRVVLAVLVIAVLIDSPLRELLLGLF